MAFTPINPAPVSNTFCGAPECSSDEDRDVMNDSLALRTNTVYAFIAQHLRLYQDDVCDQLANLTKRRRGKRIKTSTVAVSTEKVGANTAQPRRAQVSSSTKRSAVVNSISSVEARPQQPLRTRQQRSVNESLKSPTSDHVNRNSSPPLSNDRALPRLSESTGMLREVLVDITNHSMPGQPQCSIGKMHAVPSNDEEVYPDDWDCLPDDIIDDESRLSPIRSNKLDNISRSCKLHSVAVARRYHSNDLLETLAIPVESQTTRTRWHVNDDAECQFDNDWTLKDDEVLEDLTSALEVPDWHSSLAFNQPTAKEQRRQPAHISSLPDDDIDLFDSIHNADFDHQSPESTTVPPLSSPSSGPMRGTRVTLDASRPCGIQPPKILQAPLSSLVQDRSPIVGLSNSAVLAVCFRNADALAAGCPAARTPLREVVIELFCRVRKSTRAIIPAIADAACGLLEAHDRHIQHFELADLYDDDEAEVLGATFEGWYGVELFDTDARPFLEAGKAGEPPIMCRVLGRIARDGGAWVLNIVSIWATDWADVEWVRGIVCA